MGGISFDWKGKSYDIICEGGCPFFETDEEYEAFEEWRASDEGIRCFGPIPPDWSKEHYLDDRYPWDNSKQHRVDVDDPDADDAPDINWFDYVECEYGCKKHFYVTKDIHTCSYCNGPSCKQCAATKLTKCSTDGCNEWNCQGRGIIATPSFADLLHGITKVNGNWGHYYQPCRGKNKDTCHNCTQECAHCGKSGKDKSDKKMSRCSRCRFSFYCNRDCQKSDFKSHKKNVCQSVGAQQQMQSGRFMTRRMNMYA